MKHEPLFYTADRNEWRAWLEKNRFSTDQVWIIFPTQAANEPGMTYNDAVEEALCFGWIDSTAGRLDDTHGLRRFCPRRAGSSYSRPNIERLIWLDGQNKLAPDVKESVAALIAAPYVFPSDILEALRADPVVWEHYEAFSPSYQRIRVDYIHAARERPAEFQKRLSNFIAKTRDNKRITGYGGIEKYYG